METMASYDAILRKIARTLGSRDVVATKKLLLFATGTHEGIC
ncbi:hypothetical protein [Flavobacterium jumunjinense]|nr:hypothetical protein [Flavobacterium jumunjinense]